MALVTVARLREYLNQVKAGAGEDARLANILTEAESIVVDALGFTFFDDGVDWADIAASTKRVTSERSQYLRLPPYLAGSIASIVVVDGVTTTNVTVEEDTYEEQPSFYLFRPAGWGGKRYAVTATFGYGPVPGSVREVLLELAVNIWRQKDQGLFQQVQGVDSANNAVGGGSLKYVGGLNAMQRTILVNVRRQFTEVVH